MTLLHVERSQRPGVLAVTGDLDMATADRFVESVLIVADDSVDVIVDLRRLDFIDSTGVQAVILASEQLGERGKALKLVPGSRADRVFDLTGARDHLWFVDAAEIEGPPAETSLG